MTVIASAFYKKYSLHVYGKNLRSKDGTVVRALAFPGSILAQCHMWVEFVDGSCVAPRFFLRVLWFSSLHKNQHLQIPVQPG